MAKTKPELLLRIEQDGVVTQRLLRGNERVTIGRHPKTDVTIHGEKYPKRHVLFSGKNGHFQANLTGFMQGEVVARESRLSFRDMIIHDLLEQRGGAFVYPISDGKRGMITFGDVKIVFQCQQASPEAARVKPESFAAYSWFYATFRGLGRDLAFKSILLFFVLAHVFLMRYITGLPADVSARPDVTRVPERLARIIVRNPEPARTQAGRTAVGAAAGEEETESAEAEESSSGRKSGGGKKPEAQGVLGLLTGIGSSSQSNNLADFLLDEGLARELDEAISSTDLTVGRGNGESSGGSDFDALFSLGGDGDGSGGIDDLLDDLGGDGTGVSLGKKGSIEVDRISGIKGSEAALGQRTEESVRTVMLSYTGRLTYIYNKYLKLNPELSGKMVVEVEIAADGSVSGVKLVSSSMGQPEFEQEILSFVRRWKYAAIEQGTVSVTYPLFFNKAG